MLAWQPGSRLLVSAGWDTTARLWNVDTGEPILLLNTHADQVYTLAFSPDGSLLCASPTRPQRSTSGPISPTAKSGTSCRATRRRCGAWRSQLTEQRLAVGGTDRVIHVWDPLAAEMVAGHGAQAPHAIDLSQAGSGVLLSTGCSTVLQAWDLKTSRPAAGRDGGQAACRGVQSRRTVGGVYDR